MNPQQYADIGIVALAVALSSHMFGPTAAALIGPYIVILLASTIGASFALARRKKASRFGGVFFFLRVNGLAVLLTVALSAMLADYHASLTVKSTLAPIAFAVGIVGDEWPSVFRWIGSKINAAVDLFIKIRGGGSND
ncbi:MAG: hypothetical protein K0Q92_662 [Steroidobacteraceae bacterium]|jgi:hypothetical protein|nr:hypothetical protein [Steroidobacteraceae bacterium]